MKKKNVYAEKIKSMASSKMEIKANGLIYWLLEYDAYENYRPVVEVLSQKRECLRTLCCRAAWKEITR